MTSLSKPLLEVENLIVEFPTRRGLLRAIDEVSFAIDPGEVLGVVGESGAGKSLTGAAIIGLLEPPASTAPASTTSRPTACAPSAAARSAPSSRTR